MYKSVILECFLGLLSTWPLKTETVEWWSTRGVRGAWDYYSLTCDMGGRLRTTGVEAQRAQILQQAWVEFCLSPLSP